MVLSFCLIIGCMAMNVTPVMIKMMVSVIINSSSENPRSFGFSLIVLSRGKRLASGNPPPGLQGLQNAELSIAHDPRTDRMVLTRRPVFILGRAGGDVKARRCNAG